MLPLDKLSKEAELGLQAHGIAPESIQLALQLDMSADGQFGETWLCLDTDNSLHIMSAANTTPSLNPQSTVDPNLKRKHRTPKKESTVGADAFCDCVFNSYKKEDLQTTYVDNFVTTNRLLTKIDGVTTVIAMSTNARKQKLFAFLDLMERLTNGQEVQDDDPIFEQFNAKCPRCETVYEDQNRKICKNCQSNSQFLNRMFKYVRKYRVSLAIILIITLVIAAIQMATPLISGLLLYDNVIAENGAFHHLGVHMVWITVGSLLGLNLFITLIDTYKKRVNNYMSCHMAVDFKLDLFESIQRQSLSFLNKHQTGRLLARISSDCDTSTSFFTNQFPAFVYYVFNYIVLTTICLFLNWKLTLIVFIPVPLVVYILRTRLPKLWRANTKNARAYASMNAMLSDSLVGIRVVKAFAKEAEESNRFHRHAESNAHAAMQMNLISITIFPVIGLLIGISANAIWGFGGIDVLNEHMTYGEFAAFWGYIGMIFTPLNFFTTLVEQYTAAANSAQRVFEIIDAIPEIRDSADAVDMDETMRGDITFEKVDFHYTINRPIFKKLSLQIHANDNIGLVGHTGSGKSTIANLIMRMYDVSSGAVLIDGVNVKNIKQSSLRKNISIVSQEIYTFNATIADNIRYAKPDATMEEVIAAAKIANAHDFILAMPDGYETLIGTGSSHALSGGEKQRISIARAVLLAPRILILDEATAAMDTETERLIQDALGRITEGRTTITIAHRLSTLKDCNYMFAIENGTIAEQGTPEQLLEKKGIYYKLYTIQTKAMQQVLEGM
ncbi:MAG: ABC transporter ATP-binding protein [Clostridia bacterium]|nr:ABC transporter ATP-binding protein [Clostridia bacterium]